MTCRHLTLEQRYQIAALHRAGDYRKHIAEAISCHPSTIGRELRRNCVSATYVGSIAHGHARRRLHVASARAHLPEAVRLALIARLHDKHSPDQIRGRLALVKAGAVSHTTVYRYARQMGTTPSSAPSQTTARLWQTHARPLCRSSPDQRSPGGSDRPSLHSWSNVAAASHVLAGVRAARPSRWP